MQLRTEINCQPSKIKISHSDNILLFGSCFSVEIGSLLQQHCFHANINPFGTIYNAYSIAKLLNKSCLEEEVNPSEIGFNTSTELFYHFDFHTAFSGITSNDVLSKCNYALKQVKEDIVNANTIIITLGTSYVHKHNLYGLVSNCHKVPGRFFDKQLLSIQEQYEYLSNAISNIRTVNSDVTIIFTVSPVRHIKEGLSNNQLSKAYLRSTVEKLVQNHKDCVYFPSYEVLVDDLRDYRFYKDDLIHPNTKAVEYIWSLFGKTYFDQETTTINDTIKKLLLDVRHRPQHAQSQASVKHRSVTLQKIKSFDQNYPEIQLMDYIKNSVDSIL